jgi:hypothetical protein
MFPSAEELKERQALLSRLRDGGDPAAIARANELQRTYHDDNMAVLAKDTYWSAMGKDAPEEGQKAPPGWKRASENLDLLREMSPSLKGMSNDELLDYLKPRDSGFRAEIYLPDEKVLGPGYKPVIVPKGSAGEVMGPDGKLHETSAEDFVANNFPQSIGLKTDYYDRAMRLATVMERAGLNAEYSGHSLGGGMSSAMSAVTGRPATTWNAAGLHPETAARFARENPGVQVYDTSKTVLSYQIKGELLNDGVQHNINRLDVIHRTELAGVLKEACDLVQSVPEGRELLTAKLNAKMPAHAQGAVREFVGVLAEGDTSKLLRELPLAAGRVEPLDTVKVWEGDKLVDRKQDMTLTEISNFAKPVLETMYLTTQAAHIGHTVGQVADAVGQNTARTMDGVGDVTRAVTAKAADFSDVITNASHGAVQAGVRTGGEGLARVRETAGNAEALVDKVQGEVQARGANAGASVLRGIGSMDFLPDGVQQWADRNASDLQKTGQAARQINQVEAAQAQQGAREDATAIRDFTQGRITDLERVEAVVERGQRTVIAGSGVAADATLDAGGQAVNAVSQRAPVVGAGVGAAAGGAAGVVSNLNAVDITHTAVFAYGAWTKGGEAIERHLMTETVLPSMASRVQSQEESVRAQFPNLTAPKPAETAPSVPAANSPTHPRNPDHPLLEQARNGIRAIDESIGKPYDEGSERISRCLTAACKDNRELHPGGENIPLLANELNRIDHVLLGSNGNVHAVEGKLGDPASKIATVSVEQALKTPVEQSDQKLQAATQTIAQEQQRERELTQQQTQQKSALSIS